MPDLELTKKRLGRGVTELSARGFIDAHTSDQLEAILESIFSENRYRLVVSLEKLDYICSAGVGIFVRAIDTAQKHGGNIVFLKPSPNVKEVFELLGLDKMFIFAEDMDGALESFG